MFQERDPLLLQTRVSYYQCHAARCSMSGSLAILLFEHTRLAMQADEQNARATSKHGTVHDAEVRTKCVLAGTLDDIAHGAVPIAGRANMSRSSSVSGLLSGSYSGSLRMRDPVSGSFGGRTR